MGKLKDQMIMEMELRNYSPKTIQGYVGHVEAFTKYIGKSPAEAGTNEIRQYLYYLLKEKKVSWSNINVGYNGLKFFYRRILHQEWDVEHIPRPRGEKKLPVVLSRKEINKLFTASTNIKHLALLKITYGGGLRVSETAHLKIADIDSDRMLIRVYQGKGKKDRYTLLSEVALKELRCYYQKYRPVTWLFPGKHKDKPIDTGTIQRIFKTAKQKTGIRKAATPHTLRHSFATHFLEDGGDLFHLKELLGHCSLLTTIIYIHIQHKGLKKLISPLDLIPEDL